ncbi:hypothetical protein [Brevibacillus migulae]|uniref:hypothetical protein n=1 Tax=Brevibacillus migulae TaxID=1644114 RepID=UPI0014300CB4|nr:hypothetical protein [Brevibacillus migulae]
MRRDRLDEEELLVNGSVGGQSLSKQERQTLKGEAEEINQMMEKAKNKPIKE